MRQNRVMEGISTKEPIYHARCLVVNLRGAHDDVIQAAAKIFDSVDVCQEAEDIIDNDDHWYTILYPLTVPLSHTEALEERYLDAMDKRLIALCKPLNLELLRSSFL